MQTSAVKPSRATRIMEDAALLNALLAPASEEARQRHWGEFVRRYERTITSCIVKVLRRYGVSASEEDLNDLAGDVWLALLRRDMKKLRQFDAARGVPLSAYVGMVAGNTTIDHLRARRAKATRSGEELETEALRERLTDGPGEGIEAAEQAALAREALFRLSSDEREFVLEVYKAERSPEELARNLGITTNTVYSRKFKIREKLARIVANLEGRLAA
jgi:RNA polymerase sigma factor (sigma-70 family)